METFSALLALCAGKFFSDLRLNNRLSKQARCRWFDTLSRSLWRQCNDCNDLPEAGKQSLFDAIQKVYYDAIVVAEGLVPILRHDICHNIDDLAESSRRFESLFSPDC